MVYCVRRTARVRACLSTASTPEVPFCTAVVVATVAVLSHRSVCSSMRHTAEYLRPVLSLPLLVRQPLADVLCPQGAFSPLCSPLLPARACTSGRQLVSKFQFHARSGKFA